MAWIIKFSPSTWQKRETGYSPQGLAKLPPCRPLHSPGLTVLSPVLLPQAKLFPTPGPWHMLSTLSGMLLSLLPGHSSCQNLFIRHLLRDDREWPVHSLLAHFLLCFLHGICHPSLLFYLLFASFFPPLTRVWVSWWQLNICLLITVLQDLEPGLVHDRHSIIFFKDRSEQLILWAMRVKGAVDL